MHIQMKNPAHTMIFTDGAMDSQNSGAGAAFCVPQFGVQWIKRVPDHLLVYSIELLASSWALKWIEEIKQDKVHRLHMQSFQSSRQDLLFEALQALYRIRAGGTRVIFILGTWPCRGGRE